MSQARFKGQTFYLLLAVGLLLSVASSVMMVGDRADQTVDTLQGEHRELKAVLIANNLAQYVDSRLRILSDLSQLPVVTSSVMGVDVSIANLSDFISSYRVLGQQESLFFVDILGEVIFSNSEQEFLPPSWAQQALDEELEQGISIVSENGKHFLLLGKAVKYNGSTEGVIFMRSNASLESILDKMSFDGRDSLVLKGIEGKFVSATEDNVTLVLENYSVSSAGLIMNYMGSRALAEKERKEYANSIGLAIIGSLLLSFSILAVFIHSLFVNPYLKLARSEEESREHKERFELAIAGSNDGIWDWDVKSDKAYFSPRYREMMGFDGEDTLNFPGRINSFYNSLHPEDRALVMEAIDNHINKDETFDMTFRLRQNDEAYRHFRAKGVALKDASGKPVRMAGSLTDVTELKSKQEQLETARDAAQEASIAKSAFLANMSHEIRTPMNGILGSLQVLERKSMDEEAAGLIDKAVDSCQSLLSIINDILDFSKIESGKLTLEMVPSDLAVLVKNVHAELQPVAAAKGLLLEIDIDKNLHLQRIIDPVRVKQILINLVGNAIKFTKIGAVKMQLTGTHEMIKLVVSDTGIGMNEAAVASLFERFVQADSTITRKFGGTGLGLAITKQLTELMGGNIKVESEVNKGSIFTVRVPCQMCDSSESVQKSEGKVAPPNLETKTLLLAEDNRINQSVFLAMVKPTNASVIVANDGLEAINLYRKFKPDLVFMDIQMPVMDGIAAFMEISTDDHRVPVVALTANVMKEDVTKYEEAGFNGYMPKPIEINQLYSNLSTFLNT